MPTVTFLPSGRQVEVVEGTTLYEAAAQAGLPVASSCDAEGVCGKCNLTLVAGAENLTSRTDLEQRLLVKERNPLTDRISCQTRILGDCTVTARYW